MLFGLAGRGFFLRLDDLLHEALDLAGVDGDDGLAVITRTVDRGHRDGGEGDVATAQARHLLREAHDVPATVQGDGALCRVRQLAQGRRVGQRAGRQDLLHQGRHVRLLAHDAVQVAARQVVALAHKRQCLGAVEGLLAGGEVRARERLVDGGVEADVDAADGVGKQHEAQQTDLREVVDLHAGEVRHRVDQPLLARARDLLFELGVLGGAVGKQLLSLFARVRRVDAVDLHVAVVISVDVGIARDGDGGGARAVLGHAHDHDGVRVDLAVGLTRVQARELVFGQRVALGVRARVGADEQDVDRPVEYLFLLALLAADIQLGGRQLVVELADGEVAHAGKHQRSGGGSRKHTLGDGVARLLQVPRTGGGRLDVSGAPGVVIHGQHYTAWRTYCPRGFVRRTRVSSRQSVC